MSRPELEDDIRDALRRRAEQAPAAPLPRAARSRRAGSRRLQLAVGAAAAVVVVALVAVALRAGDEPSRVASGEAPAARSVLLGFGDGFHYLRVEDDRHDPDRCPVVPARTATSAPPAGPIRLQAFGPSRYTSPILFVQTVPHFGPASSFGLLTEKTGVPATIRGVPGFVLREHGPDKAWIATAILPDGDAILVTALGISFNQALLVIDGLQPDGDGGWVLGTRPTDWQDLPASAAPAGCGYSAGGAGFEVNLYPDSFDSRLWNAVEGSTGPVQQVDLGGLPAAMGDYGEDDHWVLTEPAPGQALELRVTGTREHVLDLVRQARFVDEATWAAMQPEPGTTGSFGTAVPPGVDVSTTTTTP